MMCSLEYTNKNILAPMVRIGTLPTRLLALDYGADLVYSEEIIDHRILKCTRIENALLETVDFVMRDGTITFRTCSKETSRVVFQMGTCNAQRALKVAQLVEKDVAAIDINMGCPKEFSIKGGMGAALLTQPDKIKEILTMLVENISIPVTCKIRILPTIEETIELAKLIESTGVQALAIHGRKKEERPRHNNHNDYIKAVADVLKIPVIANGGSKEINSYSDIQLFKDGTGCTAVMIARAAQWNLSIFRQTGLLHVDDVIKEYLKYAVMYDNDWSNSKYCVQQILHKELDNERGQKFQATRLLSQICGLFNMEEFFHTSMDARDKRQTELLQLEENTPLFLTRTTTDGLNVIEMPFVYSGKEYSNSKTPKSILYNHCHKNKLGKPTYQYTLSEDHMYTCVVKVDNQLFSSSYSDLSKKCGEQAAAVVCLRYLGLDDGRLVKSEDNRNHIAMKDKYQESEHSLTSGVHNECSNNRCNNDQHNTNQTVKNSDNPKTLESLKANDINIEVSGNSIKCNLNSCDVRSDSSRTADNSYKRSSSQVDVDSADLKKLKQCENSDCL